MAHDYAACGNRHEVLSAVRLTARIHVRYNTRLSYWSALLLGVEIIGNG